MEVSAHASNQPAPPAEATAEAAAEGAPAEGAPARPAPRRLWLHASLASSPGALGFFCSARTEPLGDNLRLLLNYDTPGSVPPASGVPQPLRGACRCCDTLIPMSYSPRSPLASSRCCAWVCGDAVDSDRNK